MKIIIEVEGGTVQNIVATGECSIYLIDHDNIKERCEGGAADCIADAKQAMQPYRITYELDSDDNDETPVFDECLKEALAEHTEEWQDCDICGGQHPVGFDGDCRDNANRQPAEEPKQELIGYYNLDGYRIEDNLDGEVLYEAGNNPMESSSHVDRADGLPLETIKEYCERTGKEMAEERGATFVGAFEAAEED